MAGQGSYRCVAWPWESLTTLTKALLPGTVTLLAGTVGARKSFMLMQAISHWLAEGEAVSIYALEGDKPFHLGRVLAQLGSCAEVTDPDWLAQNPWIVERLLVEHSESLEQLARCLWTSETIGAETLEQLSAWIAEQAKAGRRIICIDPVTAAARTGQPWVLDLEFLRSIKKTATEYGCSILLVTHPQRGVTEPSRENLAGSAAYERFRETIITVPNHEPKESLIRTDVVTGELEHNRTVGIEKARNGRGTGCRLAYKFEPETTWPDSQHVRPDAEGAPDRDHRPHRRAGVFRSLRCARGAPRKG
jgi:KaiC/GvpD/RAD55 family RecA-like ATPase